MAIALEAIEGGTGRTARIPLADIDPDVIDAVESAFGHNAENPADRLQARFGTAEEADAFLKEARDYAYQREAGRLVVSGNSTAKGLARFRVLAYEAPAVEADGSE
jgi:hypothetical protein